MYFVHVSPCFLGSSVRSDHFSSTTRCQGCQRLSSSTVSKSNLPWKWGKVLEIGNLLSQQSTHSHQLINLSLHLNWIFAGRYSAPLGRNGETETEKCSLAGVEPDAELGSNWAPHRNILSVVPVTHVTPNFVCICLQVPQVMFMTIMMKHSCFLSYVLSQHFLWKQNTHSNKISRELSLWKINDWYTHGKHRSTSHVSSQFPETRLAGWMSSSPSPK